MSWNKVTLVGVGLLGGSLGLALRTRKLAETVVGWVRREASIGEATQAGAVDAGTLDVREAVEGADLVLVCTPVSQMVSLVEQCRPYLRDDALITDVGSVKRTVVREMEALLSDGTASFVGSHPMAGGEKSGVAAASADLFEGATCVITPTRRTSDSARERIGRFWTSIGAELLELSPREHDEWVGWSSHLPHIVAAGLAKLVLNPALDPRLPQLCAGGFRDTTRIAAGEVTMWRDILLQNGDVAVAAIEAYLEELEALKVLIAEQDSTHLTAYLQEARERRVAWRSH